MTMLINLPPDPRAARSVRAEIGVLLVKFRRMINRWVAGVIARRERQAELAVQHYLGSCKPGEIGIYRYQVGGRAEHTSAGPPNEPRP